MYHVISPPADSKKMLIPIRGVLAHKLRHDGKYRQRVKGNSAITQFYNRADVDIVCFRLDFLLRLSSRSRTRKFRERARGRVETESTRSSDWDINLDVSVEIWLQSVDCFVSVMSSKGRVNGYLITGIPYSFPGQTPLHWKVYSPTGFLAGILDYFPR